MDLLLLNTIINIIWYIFSIIFVLYRFTTFFSYIYSILKFCGKLWVFLVWCKNKIFKPRHIYHEIGVNNTPRKPLLKRIKKSIYKFFNPRRTFTYTILPDIPLSNSEIIDNQIHDLCLNNVDSVLLDRQYNNPENENDVAYETMYLNNPLTNSFNYGSVINH